MWTLFVISVYVGSIVVIFSFLWLLYEAAVFLVDAARSWRASRRLRLLRGSSSALSGPPDSHGT